MTTTEDQQTPAQKCENYGIPVPPREVRFDLWTLGEDASRTLADAADAARERARYAEDIAESLQAAIPLWREHAARLAAMADDYRRFLDATLDKGYRELGLSQGRRSRADRTPR